MNMGSKYNGIEDACPIDNAREYNGFDDGGLMP